MEAAIVPSKRLKNDALVLFWKGKCHYSLHALLVPTELSGHSLYQPGFQRCTKCGRAACWSPLWFPLSSASPGRTARRHHTAGRHAARCCGTAGIWRCRTGRHGDRCPVASASPTSPRSGWQPRPRYGEQRGRLEEEDRKVRAQVRNLDDTAGQVNRFCSLKTNQCGQDGWEFNQF